MLFNSSRVQHCYLSRSSFAVYPVFTCHLCGLAVFRLPKSQKIWIIMMPNRQLIYWRWTLKRVKMLWTMKPQIFRPESNGNILIMSLSIYMREENHDFLVDSCKQRWLEVVERRKMASLNPRWSLCSHIKKDVNDEMKRKIKYYLIVLGLVRSFLVFRNYTMKMGTGCRVGRNMSREPCVDRKMRLHASISFSPLFPWSPCYMLLCTSRIFIAWNSLVLPFW